MNLIRDTRLWMIILIPNEHIQSQLLQVNAIIEAAQVLVVAHGW